MEKISGSITVVADYMNFLSTQEFNSSLVSAMNLSSIGVSISPS